MFFANGLIAGHWYMLYTCQKCKIRQVLFPDLSDGKSKIAATYIISCAQCGHKGFYDSDVIERYEHPLGVLDLKLAS
jgi:DNA-directed RNA polymerase subunit RPC12/RpoP